MAKEIRFGEFIREISANQRAISYNELTPDPKFDADGNEVPYRAPRLRLRGIDIQRLLTPYVGVRVLDQVRTVVPLALYLMLFQILILRQGVSDVWIIVGGFGAVIVGLMLFMEGLSLGLMPFAEVIGNNLPKKSPLPLVLLIAFILGVGVTYAEPAIGALQQAGAALDVNKAPYLYYILNERTQALVLTVGIGVGFAAVLGSLRFIRGWSLKPMIYLTFVPILLLVGFLMFDPELSKVLGLAWDTGAVTTGPVTVPLVLALGIGIAAAAGKGSSSLSGFGIVTMASLFPVIGVMLLTVVISFSISAEEIILLAQNTAAAEAEPGFMDNKAVSIILAGVRPIVPLVAFLFLVLKLVLREKLSGAGIVAYGLFLAVLGMIVFNVGLETGLAKLGDQSGGLVAGAFAAVTEIAGSPLYSVAVGIAIALAFAWALGFGATLAEPALNALGQTVENLTNGAFKKRTLMMAVALGVAFGISLGIVKIIFAVPIAYLVIPGYVLALVLTFLSSEEFVNVAWDSAGVTTGPVTVPLVLAMGLGFGNSVDAIEGFGILSMASIGPIVSVLMTGLFVQYSMRRQEQAQKKSDEVSAGAIAT
ncbi:MAG: DUF1538 domain-containing protein [Alphaproteobacteria bacterium]|nr:DUF1538 domain-containing protein [Alphaproteobacteria bacterium]